MSQREDSSSWERLDSEFQHLLVDLKPYVQKHPVKTEQQRCALWIRKLCDPSVSASGQMGRKNRNLYTRLLLHMLRRGVLEGPFATKPEPGILKTLPTYMSIYFDEPLGRRPVQPGAADLPDWVTAELAAHEQGTLTRGLLKDTGMCSPAAEHLNTLRRRLYEERSSQPVTSSPLLRRPASSRDEPRTVDDGDITMRSETCPHHDGDLEARLNSWNLGIENPRYLREKPIPLSPIFKSSVGGMNSTLLDEPVSLVFTQSKEVDLKTRLLEAKHQEEKLTMQQSHDADVQNILDRKNGEIEELKAAHRAKQRDSEESVRKLEKKVQSVLRESQVIRESKEKQIGELRKMSDQSADSLKKEWEKKVHAAVSEMEQEKFELQKKHTENIQALLEDTNLRLAKMEAEYNTQTHAADQKVRELELQVRQQAVELEKGSALRQRLTQEKAQLEITMAGISAELQEANRRSVSLMRDSQQLGEEQDAALQKLQDKHQADMNHFQQEHALSAAKASEVIEDLERAVAHLRHQLQDLEQRRQKQLRDQETKLHQDRDQLQVIWENKVQAVHEEAEKERMLTTKKTAQLEEALREVSGQLDRARDSHRLQVQQADAALDNFKLLVESSSEKTYSQMKVQMERVEEDLNRSKSLREKQAQEFNQQLEELRHRYEQQLAEHRAQQQQELSRLATQHAAERDGLAAERQREVGSLERQARHVLQQHQQHTQEWRKRDAQTISELEKQVAAVREDLRSAQGQLAEAAALREDERQRAAQDLEASLARLRGEMERYRTDLERSHHKEREAAQEKTNSRLKQIEKDYSQKLVKSAQLIVELQASVCACKEEMVSVQQAQEKRLEEANNRWEQERRATVHHADHTCKALQAKVETLQRQLNSSEKKLLSKELEFQEQVTAVRQQCEVKIKGLMPAESRQQLEDTITCLKAQVNSLQNRASLLQEDLDACRNRR